MTEDAIIVAVRAEASANEANRRLNRMNGSIDRLGTAVEASNEKIDKILLTLAAQSGSHATSRGLIDNAKFLVTALLIVLTSSVGALFVNWFLRSHH